MKPWAIFIVAILIGGAFGAGAMYYYQQNQIAEAYSAGALYGQSLTPAVSTPASVTLTLTAGTFNHAATVAADGSVAAETDKTDTLTIENTDESRSATGPVILLYNPVTDKEGLHANLETDATEVGITVGGVSEKLYHNGAYTDGVELSDLGDGAIVSITVTVTFEVAVAGTFQDGQTYTCYLYLYQPDANYCDVVSFTVST